MLDQGDEPFASTSCTRDVGRSKAQVVPWVDDEDGT